MFQILLAVPAVDCVPCDVGLPAAVASLLWLASLLLVTSQRWLQSLLLTLFLPVLSSLFLSSHDVPVVPWTAVSPSVLWFFLLSTSLASLLLLISLLFPMCPSVLVSLPLLASPATPVVTCAVVGPAVDVFIHTQLFRPWIPSSAVAAFPAAVEVSSAILYWCSQRSWRSLLLLASLILLASLL
jgi:hypothetical protein